MSTDSKPGETGQDRTLRVLQQYLNTHFQFYGRFLRLVSLKPVDAGESGQTAAAVEADTHRVFALTGNGAALHAEAMRRKIISWGLFQGSGRLFTENQPYGWSFKMDGTRIARIMAEFACKQLKDKPATYTDDPLLKGQTRKFGGLFVASDVHRFHEEFPPAFKSTCNGELVRTAVFGGGGGEQANAETAAAAITRMKADGVTTIIFFNNPQFGASYTFQATQNAYFPEWVVMGGLLDTKAGALYMDPQQWRHAFGISSEEIPRPDAEQDWYRAYKEIDPDNESNKPAGDQYFHELLQIANGIQMAGPTLTPQTFADGLRKLPRRPPDPVWSVGGSYAPDDFTYGDNVGLIWWDPTGQDPSAANQPGAYRRALNGRQFGLGQIPTEPIELFKDGITSPPP